MRESNSQKPMESIRIKITDLSRAEYNPRIMPENEMAALKTSIKTFGFVESVVVNTHACEECGDRKWVLVGGHQRTTAVEGLVAQDEAIKGIETKDGITYIPANLVDLHLPEEKLLNLALNKIKGKWDEKKLFEMIVDLKESPSIPASGFRDDEISRILDQTLDDEEDDEGEGDELDKEPRSKLGEIYELGSHRLICGDSTDPETYKKLLGDEKADMVFTDPPYNVNYKSRGEKLKDKGNESIKNDNMDDNQFRAFIDSAFYATFIHVKEGASIYICSGWSSYPQFLESMNKNGFQHSGVIIWVKNVPSM